MKTNDEHVIFDRFWKACEVLRWTRSLQKDIEETGYSYIVPHTSDSPNEVEMEWIVGSKRMLVTILPNSVDCLCVFGPHMVNDMFDQDVESSEGRVEAWEWLNS